MLADPFNERSARLISEPLQLLGARFQFESNSRELLRLVDSAYADLPRHRLSRAVPRLRVALQLTPPAVHRSHVRLEPPPLDMLSGGGFVGGATERANFVVVSPSERSALVVVSPQMLRSAYHARYEMLEFATFTLAARTQRLVSLHGACVGCRGRGILLIGPSGAGKSTVALMCLLQGLDFVAEDSVFVAPDTLSATGVANFLHVCADSLRWVDRQRDARLIRGSPLIRRRTGVRKFELDLRKCDYRLAPAPLEIVAIVFLSSQAAGEGDPLTAVPGPRALAQLAKEQAYAAGQPGWRTFLERISRLPAYQLRRGRHPLAAAEALRSLLDRRAPRSGDR